MEQILDWLQKSIVDVMASECWHFHVVMQTEPSLQLSSLILLYSTLLIDQVVFVANEDNSGLMVHHVFDPYDIFFHIFKAFPIPYVKDHYSNSCAWSRR